MKKKIPLSDADNKPYQDKNWLEKQYWQQELSPPEIAKMIDSTSSTINYWLKKHNIPTRSLSEALTVRYERKFRTRIYRNKHWLYEQYWKQNLGIDQIAKKINAGQATILHWMNKYNIPRRYSKLNKPFLDETWRIERIKKKRRLQQNSKHCLERERSKKWMNSEWLYKQYWQNNLTTADIAQLCSCKQATVLKWMKKCGVPRRTKSEIGHRRYGNGLYRDESWLRTKYCDERLSGPTIAKLCNVGKSTIYKWLEKYNIPKRTCAESSCACWAHGAYDGREKLCSGESTWIEIAVSNVLDLMEINHQSQYSPSECRFIFDEFIPPNIFVELHGTYWHGPEKPKVQRRDKRKAQWAKDNDYILIVLWEHEIEKIGAWPLIRNKVLPALEFLS